MGCLSRTPMHRKTSYNANRKTQRERLPNFQHLDGFGRLGTCLLSRLQERTPKIRRSLLEHRQLGQSQQKP